MSVLSKKMSLSGTPRGEVPSTRDVEAFLAKPLVTALAQWIMRPAWVASCQSVESVSSDFAFNEAEQADVCLITSGARNWLMRLTISDVMSKLATSNALGVQVEELSESFNSFENLHRRFFSEVLISEIFDGSGELQNPQWFTAEKAEQYCLTGEVRHFYKTLWTVRDIADGQDHVLGILLEKSVFPDVVTELEENNTPPNIDSLRERLGPCRLPVRVVGGQVTMNIADCVKLDIGQIYGLPDTDFNAVDMKMPDCENSLVQATLGMHGGTKAVRLSAPINEEFLARYMSEMDET